MMYCPLDETLLVLEQAGFTKANIQEAVKAYAAAAKEHPTIVVTSDRDFTQFIKAKFPAQARAVDRNLNNSDMWSPGNTELSMLEGEGYWQEIISAALLEFHTKPRKSNGVISKQAVFRSYLKTLEPLKTLPADQWRPSDYLTRLVENELGVHRRCHDNFMTHFRALAQARSVKENLLPRFFYNFVKKNRDLILRMSMHN